MQDVLTPLNVQFKVTERSRSDYRYYFAIRKHQFYFFTETPLPQVFQVQNL